MNKRIPLWIPPLLVIESDHKISTAIWDLAQTAVEQPFNADFPPMIVTARSGVVAQGWLRSANPQYSGVMLTYNLYHHANELGQRNGLLVAQDLVSSRLDRDVSIMLHAAHPYHNDLMYVALEDGGFINIHVVPWGTNPFYTASWMARLR